VTILEIREQYHEFIVLDVSNRATFNSFSLTRNLKLETRNFF
jgi:hypothetical protein